MTCPPEAASASSPRPSAISTLTSDAGDKDGKEEEEDDGGGGDGDAVVERFSRKFAHTVSARAGGNHSRVCSRMSGPFRGCKERARHAMATIGSLSLPLPLPLPLLLVFLLLRLFCDQI
jgi:hypothetical protein